MATYYRKRPVTVQAIRWDAENLFEVVDFLGNDYGGFISNDDLAITRIVIETLEGPMQASRGDYIIRGIHGEHYACKPEIFESSYELVEPDGVRHE